MNFRRGHDRETPEINLIPMIDVLLVILIFLMVTTSYGKFSELQINLPQAAGAGSAVPVSKPITVAVDTNEYYAIDGKRVTFKNLGEFAQALRLAASNEPDPVIVINADAKASHQSVIAIMEAARQAGYGRITFTTRSDK